MLADAGELRAVGVGAHHIGWQHGHEVRGVGLDLAHAGGHEQREGHEAGAAHNDVDHAGQRAAGEEEEKSVEFQGCCLFVGAVRLSIQGGKDDAPSNLLLTLIPTGWYVT